MFALMRPHRREDATDDLRIDAIYLRACPVELDRDLLGIHRDVRTARSETARRLDSIVPGHHCADERHRFFLSVPRVPAVSCPRHNSLIMLAVAIFARYGRHIAGPWRRTYVI